MIKFVFSCAICGLVLLCRKLLFHGVSRVRLQKVTTSHRKSARPHQPVRRLRSLVVIRELPYVMEMLALACMSGLNLLQAIETVGSMAKSPVHNAFLETSRDVAAGMSRNEALTRLSYRLNCTVGRSLALTLKQAERSGTPVVNILVAHAQAARREEATEKNKQIDLIPLKLVVCTVTTLLPAVIVTALVPHIIVFTRSGW